MGLGETGQEILTKGTAEWRQAVLGRAGQGRAWQGKVVQDSAEKGRARHGRTGKDGAAQRMVG